MRSVLIVLAMAVVIAALDIVLVHLLIDQEGLSGTAISVRLLP